MRQFFRTSLFALCTSVFRPSVFRPSPFVLCTFVCTAPVDPSECTFLALDTASPYVATYAGTDANKMAHYMLRWVTKGGDKGPWSETVSATIGG